MSRRLSVILSSLAVLAAGAATAYLLFASQGAGGGAGVPAPKALGEVDGPRMLLLLLGATGVSAVPLIAILSLPRAALFPSWTAALALLAFSALGGFTGGLFYLPSALLLLLAATVVSVARRSRPVTRAGRRRGLAPAPAPTEVGPPGSAER